MPGTENGSVMARSMHRPATPDDAGRIEELLEASYSTLMTASYDRAVLDMALPLMTRADPALLRSGRYYVCQAAEGDIIGCGGWSLERPGTGLVEPGLAHIRHFATHPACIGMGVGRVLYERCESDARLVDVDRFECYASLNAEPFYAALGFKTVKRIKIPMGDDLQFAVALMVRSI